MSTPLLKDCEGLGLEGRQALFACLFIKMYRLSNLYLQIVALQSMKGTELAALLSYYSQ